MTTDDRTSSSSAQPSRVHAAGSDEGRFVIRYHDPETYRGGDGVEYAVGWVYAVDLIDYFGSGFDVDDYPGWSQTPYANEATVYSSRAEADEIIRRKDELGPTATVVDLDAAPLVESDVGDDADAGTDIDKAALVVLSPGTRRATGPHSSRRRAEVGQAGLNGFVVAYDVVRNLSAYELAVDLLREAAPDRATEFEHVLAEAVDLLEGAPGMLTLLGTQAADELGQLAPATLDADAQAALGRDVMGIVDQMRAGSVPGDLDLDAAVGRAVLAATDHMTESAGPGRWPNAGTGQPRRPETAVGEAARALAELNELLDRTHASPSWGPAAPPPLEHAPTQEPGIGGP